MSSLVDIDEIDFDHLETGEVEDPEELEEDRDAVTIEEFFDKALKGKSISPEANAVKGTYGQNLIKLSLLYDLKKVPEMKNFIKAYLDLVNVCGTQSGPILAAFSPIASGLAKERATQEQLEALHHVKSAIKEEALGVAEKNNNIFLHEYNIAYHLMMKGYRCKTTSNGVFFFLKGEEEYFFSIQRDAGSKRKWCVQPDELSQALKILGNGYEWISRDDGIQHILLYYMIWVNITVVDKQYSVTDILIDRVKAQVYGAEEALVTKCILLRDHMHKIFRDILVKTPTVDIVQGSQHNTMFEKVLRSLNAIKFNKVELLFISLDKMPCIDEGEVCEPVCGSAIIEEYMKTPSERRGGTTMSKALIFTKQKSSKAVAEFLTASRLLRGTQKSINNSVFKDAITLGPPMPDISTYTKWRKVISCMGDTAYKNAIQIGCSKHDDWWSNVTGLDSKQVTKMDIIPDTSNGINYHDITNESLSFPPAELVLSDIYITAASSALGNPEHNVWNANAKVPNLVIKKAVEAGAHLIAIKVFPFVKDNICDFSHINVPDGWAWEFVFSGRAHNAESFIILAKDARSLKSSIPQTNYKSLQTHMANYLMQSIYLNNMLRNRSLITYRSVYPMTTCVPLDRLPVRGDDKFAVAESVVEHLIDEEIHIIVNPENTLLPEIKEYGTGERKIGTKLSKNKSKKKNKEKEKEKETEKPTRITIFRENIEEQASRKRIDPGIKIRDSDGEIIKKKN